MDDFGPAAAKTYEYTRLRSDEIRLVILHPGIAGRNSHRDQRIQCTLVTSALGDAQKRCYEALSYVWSSGNFYGYSDQLYPEEMGRLNERTPLPHECRIWCQHEEAEKSGLRKVTGNLIEALSRLRHASENRILWVDALCINQDDMAEKATQVPLMARIYSCASQVLIWLGETLSRPNMDVLFNRPDITDAAFAHIAWVNQLPLGMRNFNTYISTRPSEYLNNRVFERFGMFQEFLARCAWFQRTWIFQEAVMAGKVTVICGGHRASWEALYEACSFDGRGLEQRNDLIHPGRNIEATKFVLEIQRLRSQRQSPEMPNRPFLTDASPWRFDQLLHTIRSKSATDLHDKIYAVLSLTSDQGLPRPDYCAPLSKVYCDTARCLSRSLDSGWISVLSYAELSDQSTLEGLPSWVPDWRWPNNASPVSWYSDFQAAGISVAKCCVLGKEEGNLGQPLLSIRGVRLFTVDGVAKAAHEDEYEPIDMPWDKTETYPLNYESYLVAYSNVARPGIMSLTNPKEDPFSLRSSPFWESLEQCTARQLERAGRKCQYDRTLSTPSFYSHLPEELPTTGLRVGFTSMHKKRRLFLGSSGCLGLAPLATKRGDHVCLFFGGRVLYVIRPVPNGRFTFVGECFVYGLMYGEAMESLPELRKEDFILE
ncbi:heterokaryon incompatibility protein-domain-containing protein [Nemania abortiva]|nr:heterokaryon incompatibility protein-domain-containing protein [Nemania abortiva]